MCGFSSWRRVEQKDTLLIGAQVIELSKRECRNGCGNLPVIPNSRRGIKVTDWAKWSVRNWIVTQFHSQNRICDCHAFHWSDRGKSTRFNSIKSRSIRGDFAVKSAVRHLIWKNIWQSGIFGKRSWRAKYTTEVSSRPQENRKTSWRLCLVIVNSTVCALGCARGVVSRIAKLLAHRILKIVNRSRRSSALRCCACSTADSK